MSRAEGTRDTSKWYVKANPEILPANWRNDRKMVEDVYIQVEDLYDEGLSANEIAAIVGISSSTVGKMRLDNFELPLHPEDRRDAKLESHQVVDIKDRYSTGNISQASLAREYNVCGKTIHRIVRGKSWKGIE